MAWRHLMIAGLLAAPLTAAAQTPLTIDDAIREAQVANARLPAARLDVRRSETFLAEARSDLLPTVSIGGSAHDARPGSPDLSLEAFARGPLYDPSIRARMRVARANMAAEVGRFRTTVADVELDVRARFSDTIEAQAEVAITRESIASLTSYVEMIRLRQVAGEGVEADLLNAQAAVATQQAALVDAELRVAQDLVALDDVLGRDPLTPLVLAPPPPPITHASSPGQRPWLTTPDVAVAAADVRAASEAIDVARAEHQPSLVYEVGAGLVGIQPAQDPSESYSNRVLRGFGGSATISLSWTLWDFGGYRARTTRANIDRSRAVAIETVTVRAARLAFEQARIDLDMMRRAIEINVRAVSTARDAYLAAASVYRGGSGTALAVIDAHRVWVSAAIASANVELRYRLAEAHYLRQGGR